MILSYPIGTATHSVTLPNPSLGDSVAKIVKTNLHIMMTGAVIGTKRTPSSNKLLMDFPYVKNAELSDLVDFLTYVNGRRIKFYSAKMGTWYGNILSNPLEIIQQHSCGGTFTIEAIVSDATAMHRIILEDGSGFLQLEDDNYILLETNHE